MTSPDRFYLRNEYIRFILQNSFWHTGVRQYLDDHIPWQLRELLSRLNLPNCNQPQNFPELTYIASEFYGKKQESLFRTLDQFLW